MKLDSKRAAIRRYLVKVTDEAAIDAALAILSAAVAAPRKRGRPAGSHTTEPLAAELVARLVEEIESTSKAATARKLGVSVPTLERLTERGAASAMVVARIGRALGVVDAELEVELAPKPRRKVRNATVAPLVEGDFEADLEFERSVTAGLLD
jgi:hypothetical protein